jgi:uncharacterized membrane protein (UPF0136 family)
VRLLVRTAVGLALLAGGLTFLTYGIAQAVDNGSCGTSSSGRSVGPPCPSGFGPMILLMVLGTFAAFAGSSVFASRERGLGLAVVGGMVGFFAATVVCALAGVVFGIVEVHPDDTRPGLEIVAVVAATVLLTAIPALLRSRGAPVRAAPVAVATGIAGLGPAPPPAAAAGASASAPRERTSPGKAEDVAVRLRELQQLRSSGLLDADEYAERRKQILADL